MEAHSNAHSERRSGWQWWLGAVVGVVAFVFGAVGLWQYDLAAEHGGHPDALSVFYHTLQLFILHAPHLEHPAPWQLHVGRLLAAGLFFAAAGKALVKVFRDEVQLVRLWLPWRREHVVVCGLGDLGLRLALDGRRRGRFVVALEKNGAPAVLEQARASRVVVLEGDACDPEQLRRARLERAEFIVAAGPDDHTNIAIAAIAGQFAQRRAAPLECRLLIRDAKLRAIVGDEALFPRTGSGYRVNFSDLNLENTAARQAFSKHRLDFESIEPDASTLVHLVVVGFGPIGQSLALQAARIGHFANGVGDQRRQLHITVADADPDAGWSDFRSRYRNFGKVCVANFAQCGPDDHGFVEAMAALSTPPGSGEALVTYALCVEDDDRTNLQLGLELAKQTAERKVQVLIHQTSSTGFAPLFPPTGRGSGVGKNVHAFGMKDDVFTWDVLLHESEDKIARAVHENYRATSGETGVHEPWDGLAQAFRDSNRQAADHVPIKLRALGYIQAPLRAGEARIESFDDAQMDLLAKMEHARWCAERWLAGWEYGKPTDRVRKINECLVPWVELEEKDKKKDWNQIEAIPNILRSVGLGIYKEVD